MGNMFLKKKQYFKKVKKEQVPIGLLHLGVKYPSDNNKQKCFCGQICNNIDPWTFFTSILRITPAAWSVLNILLDSYNVYLHRKLLLHTIMVRWSANVSPVTHQVENNSRTTDQVLWRFRAFLTIYGNGYLSQLIELTVGTITNLYYHETRGRVMENDENVYFYTPH